MDFKVAGTKDGITSLQMDIKITGITFEIMEQALKQAKDGRVHILGEMNKALGKSRDAVGKHTPKMEKITVDKKDIATVIGKGGATIREIVEKSGAKVDVNDEGVVTVAAPDDESRNKAMQFIKDLTAKAEMNKIYNGKVIKIMEFGAFVNFLGKQDGLVHISELANKRVAKVTDVLKEGDAVKVKVIGFDRGKVKLSIKQAAVWFKTMENQEIIQIIKNLKGRRAYEEKKASKLGFTSLYAYFEDKILRKKKAEEDIKKELEKTRIKNNLKSKQKKSCSCC